MHRLAPFALALAGLAAAAQAPATAPAAPPVRLKPYQLSPFATATQALGLSTVKVDYYRPAVKGRKVWGELVPFGQPWRAGANDATVITFSDPVKVNGKDLAAGSYAFFAIPGPEVWTLVFNTQAKQWGAYNYKADQDALRVEVKPTAISHQEWLAYAVEPVRADALRVELRWEKLAVAFEAAFDTKGLYWKHLEETLAKAPATDWVPWFQAANYCHQENIQPEKAMAWADASLKAQETYRNAELKARLLHKAGKASEAIPFLDKAIALAAAAKTPAEYQAGLAKLKGEWSAPAR